MKGDDIVWSIDHFNRYVSNVTDFIVFYEDVLNYELIDKGVKTNGKSFTSISNIKVWHLCNA